MAENVTELIEDIKADVQRLQRSLFQLADKVSQMEVARTYDDLHRRHGAYSERRRDAGKDGFTIGGHGAPAVAVNGVADRLDATA